jgi:hypothetical protein
MKLPKSILTPIIAGMLASVSSVVANTTILENADFSSQYANWNVGSNLFTGTVWQQFASAPDAYSYASRVTINANSATFSSWDDGVSDKVETFLYQEFFAGPPTSGWPTVFSTGDVIVFKGTARATKSGTNTADVIVRAFVKTLGYNSQGWEFQTLPEYSDFYVITATDGSFELSMTYPDIAVNDNLQVVQLGFEATTAYDGAAMDSATITFSGLEGYIEGEEVTPTWLGFDVDGSGWANTNNWIGWVWTGGAPWVWSTSLNKNVYVPGTEPLASGEWIFVPN